MRDVLGLIVGGYERGGTTVIQHILANHPELDSGFESGLLLAPTPIEFLNPEYHEYNRSLIRHGWGVTEEELRDYILATDSWSLVYRRLREKSRVIKDKSATLFDKTPRYMAKLADVLERTNYEVPAVIIVRSALSVLGSWIKRLPAAPGDSQVMDMCVRYNNYAINARRAMEANPDLTLLVQYAEFCESPEQQIKRILDFIGLDYSAELLEIDPKFGVRGGSVSKSYLTDYEKVLGQKHIEMISAATDGDTLV